MSETAFPESGRIVLERAGNPVQLKQLVPEDAQAYFDLISYNPDHLRQYGDTTADKYPDVAAVRRSIEQPADPNKYRFGIWDGDTMVGSDNIRVKEDGKAELGSWVSAQYIGRGYAGYGRELLIDFAFNGLGLDEVYCDITVGNTSSRRSVEKSGFGYVGQYTTKKGEQRWRYALLRDERA
jgi:ribosomal-protein-serine acetyltransferase